MHIVKNIKPNNDKKELIKIRKLKFLKFILQLNLARISKEI